MLGIYTITLKELKFIVLGVVASGFGPLIGGTLFYLLRGKLEDIGQGLVFSLLAYPFAILFCCVFGLPLFFLARRYRLVRWWSAIGCGLFAGCAAQFVVLSGTAHIDNLLPYAAHGVASASLFFLVWRWGTNAKRVIHVGVLNGAAAAEIGPLLHRRVQSAGTGQKPPVNNGVLYEFVGKTLKPVLPHIQIGRHNDAHVIVVVPFTR